MLILYAEFVVMAVMLIPSQYPIYSYINMVIFNTGSFLALASHLKSMFSDPVSTLKDLESNLDYLKVKWKMGSMLRREGALNVNEI